MIDDEEPRPDRLSKPPLDPLGIGELEDYISELKAEISRCETAIARKQGHRTAADSFFRSK